MFFATVTNIIVSSMLILGGSATVHDLTGMPTLAACFLIPSKQLKSLMQTGWTDKLSRR